MALFQLNYQIIYISKKKKSKATIFKILSTIHITIYCALRRPLTDRRRASPSGPSPLPPVSADGNGGARPPLAQP